MDDRGEPVGGSLGLPVRPWRVTCGGLVRRPGFASGFVMLPSPPSELPDDVSSKIPDRRASRSAHVGRAARLVTFQLRVILGVGPQGRALSFRAEARSGAGARKQRADEESQSSRPTGPSTGM